MEIPKIHRQIHGRLNLVMRVKNDWVIFGHDRRIDPDCLTTEAREKFGLPIPVEIPTERRVRVAGD